MKIRMTCSDCGSENVLRDAWASWNVETQEWELGQVFDEAFCEQCEGACKIGEIPAEVQP